MRRIKSIVDNGKGTNYYSRFQGSVPSHQFKVILATLPHTKITYCFVDILVDLFTNLMNFM